MVSGSLAWSARSDIYTTPDEKGQRCMLVVRACLGEAHYASRPCQRSARPPERKDGRGPLSSVVARVLGDGGVVEYPEYVVFKETQARSRPS